jgi:hypothetical protein
MESLPTCEQKNLSKYYDIVRRLDPELYLIKIALMETGINPLIIPKIIRSMSYLSMGSGYGRVVVYMQKMVVTQIKQEENQEINEKAMIDK